MKKLIYILFPLLTACTWDEVISTPEDYHNNYTRTDTTTIVDNKTVTPDTVQEPKKYPITFTVTVDGWTEVKDTINF